VKYRISLREANGDSVTLSDLALRESNRLFEEHFHHPPEYLGGSLIEDNRRAFQHAYLDHVDARVAETGLDAAQVPSDQMESIKQAAAKVAVGSTPYGAARVRQKYGDFEVTMSGEDVIEHGTPQRIRIVPLLIDVVARPTRS
jgi:hypothetical protein